jgi:hypothetical protein
MGKHTEGMYFKGNSQTHKRCPICGELKERSEYWKWKSRKDGLTAYCKVCFNAKNKKWYKENPDKLPTLAESRAYSRNKNFGISEEDYSKMLVDQDNSCAICKIQIGWEAAVDHCHATNKVRGLLCRNCNLGLGGFKDNIETIRKAIEYVKNM